MTIDYTLYAITNRALLGSRSLGQTVEEVIEGGVTVVQLREKGASTVDLIRLCTELLRVTRPRGVPLIVNDRVDVMLATGADGVHVGPDDMPPEIARRLIGRGKILGVSAGTPAEAIAAASAGADYLGVGDVFGTRSKADAGEPIGLSGLRDVMQATTLPVVAIGGITPENAKALAPTGVAGIAVMRAIFGEPDVGAAVRRLRESFNQSCERR